MLILGAPLASWQAVGSGMAVSYRVDPVNVAGDPGEDRWLAGVVAAQSGAEAHDTVHLPLAVRCLAIQWSARVPLRKPELGMRGGRGCPEGPGS